MIENSTELGNVIRLTRVNAGLSQQQLSKLAQCTEMAISRIENNRNVGEKTLNRILKVLEEQ